MLWSRWEMSWKGDRSVQPGFLCFLGESKHTEATDTAISDVNLFLPPPDGIGKQDQREEGHERISAGAGPLGPPANQLLRGFLGQLGSFLGLELLSRLQVVNWTCPDRIGATR